MRKAIIGVSNEVRHKPGCTATEDGFKFWMKKEEGLYSLCSKNKGADQLHGYSVADLNLCFLYSESRFSHDMDLLLILPCMGLCIVSVTCCL